jgi:hypothetical protein
MSHPRRLVRSRRIIARSLATVAVASTLASLPIVSSSGADAATRRCNGMAALCNRTAGDVAFPTAHNAMSSPQDGFRGPNQGKPMAWQLAHGIRGFQIDAYFGRQSGDRVSTVFTGALTDTQLDLSPALLAAGRRLHQQLAAPASGAATDVYLCHTFCELGAVRLSDELRVVRAFLDHHSDEVLQIVVQDYVPPERLRQEFYDAGLGTELASSHPGTPLPTLGEMIDAGTHLLVSLENGDGGPQLANAFAGLVEETPFTFLRATELRGAASCTDNRGVAASPVFQLNHWVTPPVRAHAVAANRLLGSRVTTCRKVRERVPTLIAVDFADHSDVVRVAARVNRAGAA